MIATLFSNEIILGIVQLKVVDASMNVVGGTLSPNGHYYVIQEIFRRSRGAYTDQLKELNLNIQLENGCFLFPQGGFSINDYADFPDEITIDLPGIQLHAMESFFLNSPPSPFLLEPWYPLSIQQKAGFEAELKIELHKGIHKLSGLECIAYANFGASDDVLFKITSNTEIYFAVVHLTWKQAPEQFEGFPNTEYFESFEAFKEKRMNIDAQEWDSSDD